MGDKNTENHLNSKVKEERVDFDALDELSLDVEESNSQADVTEDDISFAHAPEFENIEPDLSLLEIDDEPVESASEGVLEELSLDVEEESLQEEDAPFPMPTDDVSVEDGSPFGPVVDAPTSLSSSQFELEEIDPNEFQQADDLDLPTLEIGGFEKSQSENLEYDDDVLSATELYKRVLTTLYESEDMGIDATAKARVSEAMRQKKPPQLIARDLVNQKVVNAVQMSRSIARTQKRKEITSFLGVPHESMDLRRDLDTSITKVLREARVIPLWHKVASDSSDQKSELHLANDRAIHDLLLEAALSEFLPDHKFIWHFAMRDVCGAFWLAGESDDIDSSMEAEALLDRIVGNAIDARCSDIHIDPSIKGEFKAIVKYRVDGSVQSKEVITQDQLERLKIRIENIARMPKVDLNHPNKGAFTRAGFDWRVQIQPHAGRQGPVPRIVLRRLQPDVMPMEALGYPEYFTQYVRDSAKSPNGAIFWTGPTGSGKTESIHSAVVSVNPMGRGLSVHTIEDPPEKRVPGYAVQMEIAEADPARSGLELLKSSLRADPDVVIFGEVRDAEMAGLVFEAANTGHLVFSTLHTNSSLDAIIRLDELGIYGYMISYVRGIAAQRLVRRLCTHCRIPMGEQVDDYTRYVFDKYAVDLDGAKLYRHDPNGCASCSFSGYSGRIAIAEWLKPNKELIDVSTARDYSNLEAVARRAGWKPMGYMGVLHVKNGITDAEELSNKVLELAGDNV